MEFMSELEPFEVHFEISFFPLVHLNERGPDISSKLQAVWLSPPTPPTIGGDKGLDGQEHFLDSTLWWSV